MPFIHTGIKPETFAKCAACFKLVKEATSYAELIPEDKLSVKITCPHCKEEFDVAYSSPAKLSIKTYWE